jgi:hypothetical protein
VELSKVVVHSRHGGKYHAAEGVRIAAKGDSDFRDVVAKPLASADAAVSFSPTKARGVAAFLQGRRESIGGDSGSSVLLGRRRGVSGVDSDVM